MIYFTHKYFGGCFHFLHISATSVLKRQAMKCSLKLTTLVFSVLITISHRFCDHENTKNEVCLDGITKI